ncbi:MAG: hypothetical protein PWQ91_1067 [Eubacteriales bacterium]|nr:hypothetical protein [Eubacteriales bacterium]MDN5364006.1 hypothetical protein [Eubacteriales bacterium]
MGAPVYIALLHYPVYNKNMEVIATSITNMDLHDIARSARTYNVTRYYLIHPYEPQRRLMQDILEYWRDGYGGEYNPDRREAFLRVALRASLAEVEDEIERETGFKPLKVTTDARRYPNTVSYRRLREEIRRGEKPFLILFGTGWGIEKGVMLASHYILEPVMGGADYNHLSVRAAAAIILDRLLGESWWEENGER